MIDWQPWNISVGETRTLVNIVLRLRNPDYATWIIYSQLFISFLPIVSPSRRGVTQFVQWLNYAEIGDVIGTRSLIYRRFSSASPSLSILSGSYNLHNGLLFSFFLFLFFILLPLPLLPLVKSSRTKPRGVARLVLCARRELAASRSHNRVINRRVISVNQLFSMVNTLVYLIRICILTVHSVVRASKQEALRPGNQPANYGRNVYNNYTPYRRVKSGLRGPILL